MSVVSEIKKYTKIAATVLVMSQFVKCSNDLDKPDKNNNDRPQIVTPVLDGDSVIFRQAPNMNVVYSSTATEKDGTVYIPFRDDTVKLYRSNFGPCDSAGIFCIKTMNHYLINFLPSVSEGHGCNDQNLDVR